MYLHIICALIFLTGGAIESVAARAPEPIQPLPKSSALDPDKVALGRRLFFDKRLSADNTIACASCHDLKKGGTDQQVVSIGIHQQKGHINSPTVFNARYNVAQFWDGRAKDLAEQADGPVNNPIEMGSNWPQVVAKLKADAQYQAAFTRFYHGKINQYNIIDAIVTFENSLITPARFDDYLRGDKNAITAEEQAGYVKFKTYGCVACHNGINVGGGSFQKVGFFGDYFADRGHIQSTDYGRFNVTQDPNDKFTFKVPSLRNVAITPPYFHDGSQATLTDAVRTMGQYQLGKSFSDQDVKAIVAFLGSLTGKTLEHDAAQSPTT